MRNKSKHKNYELLNLIGYGLAKFDNAFISEFGFTTKSAFFNYFVENKLVDTSSVVKKNDIIGECKYYNEKLYEFFTDYDSDKCYLNIYSYKNEYYRVKFDLLKS